MLAQHSDLNVPTWIIGEPLGTPGFDTKTRLLKVWTNRELIQLKTANEFNEELEELLARHCKPGDGYAEDPNTGDQQIQWHPSSMLPTFALCCKRPKGDSQTSVVDIGAKQNGGPATTI